MKKTTISITLDQEVYNWLQQQTMNRSKVINEYFSAIMMSENNLVNKEIEELQEQLQTLKTRQQQTGQEMGLIIKTLQDKQIEEAKKQKEQEERNMIMADVADRQRIQDKFL